MAFNFRPYDTQKPYIHLFPSSSPNHTIIDGLWSGRSVEQMNTREAIQRELEKEILREEILAEEIERRQQEILETEMRRELILEHEMTSLPRIGGFSLALVLGKPLRTPRYAYEPEMLLPFPVENRRNGMQFQERCDGSGFPPPEVRGFEAVPLQWQPLSPRIRTVTVDRSNDDKTEMIGLGLPTGLKRKLPSSPAPSTSKKGNFRCADCNIKASSAQSLEEHLSGRKHLAMQKKIMKGRMKGKKH